MNLAGEPILVSVSFVKAVSDGTWCSMCSSLNWMSCGALLAFLDSSEAGAFFKTSKRMRFFMPMLAWHCSTVFPIGFIVVWSCNFNFLSMKAVEDHWLILL